MIHQHCPPARIYTTTKSHLQRRYNRVSCPSPSQRPLSSRAPATLPTTSPRFPCRSPVLRAQGLTGLTKSLDRCNFCRAFGAYVVSCMYECLETCIPHRGVGGVPRDYVNGGGLYVGIPPPSSPHPSPDLLPALEPKSRRMYH